MSLVVKYVTSFSCLPLGFLKRFLYSVFLDADVIKLALIELLLCQALCLGLYWYQLP